MRFSLLDFKLGLRMLVRYPGLTIVACLAIGVAIGLGCFYFEATQKLLNPTIPLDEGERLIAIQRWETLAAPEDALALQELAMGRSALRSIDGLGAAIRFQRNLITSDGRIESVRGAEITAAAFQLARVAPIVGRPILLSDEDVDAAPAAVIGYSLWQSRFKGNAGVIGETVKLGSLSATVVGIMPEGFAYPFAEQIWMPLRLSPSQFRAAAKPGAGPAVSLIGRLAPGVSLDDAQAELDAMAGRLGANSPEALRQAGPRVLPYGQSLLGPEPDFEFTVLIYSVHIVVVLLLFIICSSVASLVFARTTARAWEITLRNALGAGRWRIVSQLFVEALVLAGAGAVIGIAAATGVMRFFVGRLQGSSAPFWLLVPEMSPWTIAYAALLTLAGALIIGILPGLRFTRHDLHLALQREGSARSGVRFGGFWTAVIVVQVAVTVALIPIAGGGASLSSRFERRAKALNAEKYLASTFSLEPEIPARDASEAAAFAARSKATYQEIEERLLAEPDIEAVAFAERLPGQDQFKYRIAVDTQAASASAIRAVTSNSVSAGFFAAFGATVLAGRGFNPGDEPQRGVIVNESFVRHVLEGRNAIGQRLRFPAGRNDTVKPDQWYEIVGVTQDLGSHASEESRVEASAVYFPMTAGETQRVNMAVRVRGNVDAVAQRLRRIAIEADPTLRVNNVGPLARVNDGEAQINWVLTSVVSAVSIMTLLLSATGIHALMAFAVTRRTREIGIRAALGAQPQRIVSEIFSRAFFQVASGVVAGVGLAMLFDAMNSDFIIDAGLLLTAAGVMLAAGLVASAAPLRRALRVDPTEALRREG